MMSEQTKYEYRIRGMIAGQIAHEHNFGKRSASEAPSGIERELNEMADEGWELMPMTMDFAEGYVGLIFKRPRR